MVNIMGLSSFNRMRRQQAEAEEKAKLEAEKKKAAKKTAPKKAKKALTWHLW